MRPRNGEGSSPDQKESGRISSRSTTDSPARRACRDSPVEPTAYFFRARISFLCPFISFSANSLEEFSSCLAVRANASHSLILSSSCCIDSLDLISQRIDRIPQFMEGVESVDGQLDS